MIYYLHWMGIAHRDLKPENILMVDSTDDSAIKLVDFGLSKTFLPGEKCQEPYGTLGYVAPEVLMRIPYDIAVDCWAFGIILFLMLGRHIPFDSDDDRKIGRMTIHTPINFDHPAWRHISNEGKDLVAKLLVKNPKKRITIKQALDHQWLATSDPILAGLRQRSQERADKLVEFVSYSNFSMEQLSQLTNKKDAESSHSSSVDADSLLQQILPDNSSDEMNAF